VVTDNGAWRRLLDSTKTVFGAPSFEVFVRLMWRWALAPGHRTIITMIGAGDLEGRRAHDASHRFFR